MVDLSGFTEGPTTASKAGLSQDQRRRAIEAGLIEPVTKKGEVVTVKGVGRGRPSTLLKLTRKGRKQATTA